MSVGDHKLRNLSNAVYVVLYFATFYELNISNLTGMNTEKKKQGYCKINKQHHALDTW